MHILNNLCFGYLLGFMSKCKTPVICVFLKHFMVLSPFKS